MAAGIRCGDAEPFRVELGASGFRKDFKGPERGETCRMTCYVKRQEAKWDFSDPALNWKSWPQGPRRSLPGRAEGKASRLRRKATTKTADAVSYGTARGLTSVCRPA